MIDLDAFEIRAHRLMKKAFDTLKSEMQDCDSFRPGPDRSRLYSIFTTWKLYIKEKVLLKRYLVECGDGSMKRKQLISNISFSKLN